MIGTRYSLEVQPVIPERLSRLTDFSNDLLYSWDRDLRSLFYRLDRPLWFACGSNPKVFLRRVSQEKLEDASKDRVFMQDYNRVATSYDTYLKEKQTAPIQPYLDQERDLVAYFCAEFGFHESFPIYSGGLGILAGDHCKAASDLNVPFVAMGLLYRQGYFNQTFDIHGKQIATYRTTHFEDLPVEPAWDANGEELLVQVELPGRVVDLKVWLAKAGHITLYLLDSDLESNGDTDRAITHQLYGGDIHTRIQQEIVLGIGGVRALRAMGLVPTVWHINEGHAAFQILERCREYVQGGSGTEAGLGFDAALELVAAATVYTTHTPVPAGHDRFDPHMISTYFADYLDGLGIDNEQFLDLGTTPSHTDLFNMTILALHGSRFHNGVSRIHGGVASDMEYEVWPQIPPQENPIGYVTNGIHVPSFLALEFANLFNMQFGGGWRNELLNTEYWDERIDQIPDHRYWSLRQSLKSNLLQDVHRRLLRQMQRNGCSHAHIERLTRYLKPEEDALVIGFARRFATYKRALLIFSDEDRLKRLLGDEERPVLLIFAGKAHPSDEPGQELIRRIHEYSMKPEFAGKIILLEGYNIAMARKLLAGVDVWLNNPQYPLEASGTSGEKAGINGVINLSVLDGWWDEGYDPETANGWAITPHGPDTDPDFRDQEEGQELLDLLENCVIPLYFSRGGRGYPQGWVRKSKASMKTLLPRFNAARMVMDYVRDYYGSAAVHGRKIQGEQGEPARRLAEWKQRVRAAWPEVGIRRMDDPAGQIKAGTTLAVEVGVRLNGLNSDDVVVECLVGTDDERDGFQVVHTQEMVPVRTLGDGEQVFGMELSTPLAGLQYYKIRVFPFHDLLCHRFETGCMQWL